MTKNTPLYDRHVALGAKMTDFAGYMMPVVYKGIIEEHEAVRKYAGIFDVSHMGEFIVKGKQALELVQSISSNDASALAIGQAQYSCLPNDNGGIVDDMLVYRLPEDNCAEGEQAFMLVVNASNIDKDWNHIQKFATGKDVRLINISDETGLVAVQGPEVSKLLQSLTDINLSSMPYYHFAKGTFAGVENVIISATGYTGAGGFELYAPADKIVHIWDTILALSPETPIQPAGLGARDTLRLEMGFCLYGNDIDDTTSVIEAGLSWITKLKKTTPFPSQAIFASQKKEGVSKKLVGLKVTDRRVPRHGYKIVDADQNEIGVVTSGTSSPTLQFPIGLGYVQTSHAQQGQKVYIQAGSKALEAEIVPVPFIKS